MNLELIVDWPGASPLVRDYLAGEDDLADFYSGGHFTSAGAYRAKATEVDGRFARAAREVAARAIHGGDPERLERWVEESGYLVTTGQQPGLFGGPLYSVYKAVTAIRLARALEELLDRPVLPLYWVASDDHDWAEANHTCVVDLENELACTEVEAPEADVRPPLHRIPLDQRGREAADAFISALPDSDFSQPFTRLVREATEADDATLPSIFHHVMKGLLADHGLYFTDAAHPALKEASRPVLDQELERAEELEGILKGTAQRLEEAGYGLQVTLMDGGVNLFLEGPAGRERLYREAGGFRLRTSGEHLSAEDVRARAAEDASVLSPNVLLRPVVESAVFPTLAYVAGPGEMAYFAQLADYFQAFDIGMPVIHPRHGVTVVESKIRKVLDKFELDIEELDGPFHELAGRLARDDVPDGVQRALGKLKGEVAKGVSELQKETNQIDPTLKGPVQHVRSQAFQALDEVEKKVVQALKRENDIALAQLEKAQLHLFPEGKPQERVMNVFYYLTRYGGAFLDELGERFKVNLT